MFKTVRYLNPRVCDRVTDLMNTTGSELPDVNGVINLIAALAKVKPVEAREKLNKLLQRQVSILYSRVYLMQHLFGTRASSRLSGTRTCVILWDNLESLPICRLFEGMSTSSLQSRRRV